MSPESDGDSLESSMSSESESREDDSLESPSVSPESEPAEGDSVEPSPCPRKPITEHI